MRRIDNILTFPERTFYDEDGECYYEPFLSDDGRVGYRVGTTKGDGNELESFIYLNPSACEGPSDQNVFVYEGSENDPNDDEPICFINVTGVNH